MLTSNLFGQCSQLIKNYDIMKRKIACFFGFGTLCID
jgi:hypothetical protein